jgi:hypothetical protein
MLPNTRVLEEDEGLAAVLGQSSDGQFIQMDVVSVVPAPAH